LTRTVLMVIAFIPKRSPETRIIVIAFCKYL
jgi:hypothetical protein